MHTRRGSRRHRSRPGPAWAAGRIGPRGLVFLVLSLPITSCGDGRADHGEHPPPVPHRTRWVDAAPLPSPITNNAVAAIDRSGQERLFSFLGLDSTRVHSGVVDRSFRYDVGSGTWTRIPGPGTARLAGTARAVRGRIYLFGGYTVAADGAERSLPDLDIYDPAAGTWSSGAPIPVPVDDAVSGVWRDSLIYLISGWSDRDNVRNVQVYDPAADRWRQATPTPGPAVFGHAGGIVGNTIVYADGVRTSDIPPRFRMTDAVYRGEIDPTDPTSIEWIRSPPHPGPPLYRMAAGPHAGRIVFAGGTPNPYNYDGIGYDGAPSEPSDAVFAYDVESRAWQVWPAKPVATMDHRAFAVLGDRMYIIGGMETGQRVTTRVQRLTIGAQGAR